MGPWSVPPWPRNLDDTGAIVGAGDEWLLAESAGGAIPLVLGGLGVVCALVGMCLAVVDMVRGRAPISHVSISSNPEQAGFLATGFVSGDAARWVAATIIHSACTGTIALVDERKPGMEKVSTSTSPDILLEFTSDPRKLAAAVDAGELEALVIRAVFGAIPERGARVVAERSGAAAIRLSDVTTYGLRSLAGLYSGSRGFGHPRRLTLVACSVGAIAGLAAAILALSGDPLAAVVGLAALVLGAAGLTSWFAGFELEPGGRLTDAGHALRSRAKRGGTAFDTRPIDSVAEGELLLPWAVLFGLPAVVRRFAHFLERSESVPAWYRCEGPFTAPRFVACVNAIEDRMLAPQYAGGGAY